MCLRKASDEGLIGIDTICYGKGESSGYRRNGTVPDGAVPCPVGPGVERSLERPRAKHKSGRRFLLPACDGVARVLARSSGRARSLPMCVICPGFCAKYLNLRVPGSPSLVGDLVRVITHLVSEIARSA
ncbi:protein of unknown function [Methylococcus capsulatus]|uniref:Uncharacterized protein n=1 Tax=Methylococcus capsulatus TaxID=414 RepID=A0AA35XT13_METCP|nr:protein of unknown function [Methylococcus capsulatus]